MTVEYSAAELVALKDERRVVMREVLKAGLKDGMRACERAALMVVVKDEKMVDKSVSSMDDLRAELTAV